MKVLILAGGGGTRLWPLSRANWPKQFLSLSPSNPETSLLLGTIERCLSDLIKPEDIYLITGASLVEPIRRELQRVGYEQVVNNIIAEPMRRNTAPAIALAAQHIFEMCADENEMLAVLPADHAFSNPAIFREQLQEGAAFAEDGAIVTLGITPTHPETGYGYIQVQPSEGRSWFPVEQFVEKPNFEMACSYLQQGNYFWNAGIFLMSLKTIRQALAQHAPDIAALTEQGAAHAYQYFNQMPDISIDYAIMERVSNLRMLPLKSGWSDMGSWDNVYEASEKTYQQNVLQGQSIMPVDTSGCLFWSETNRAIATIGLRDYLVVDTHDALLIAKKGESQRLKEAVSALEAQSVRIDANPDTEVAAWGKIRRLTRQVDLELWDELPAAYQLWIQPNQLIKIAVVQLAQWCVQLGDGNWQASDGKLNLMPGTQWQQSELEADCILSTGESGLTLLLLGIKPQIELYSSLAEVSLRGDALPDMVVHA